MQRRVVTDVLCGLPAQAQLAGKVLGVGSTHTHTQSRTMQAPRERGEHTPHPLELTSTTIATSLLYEKALAKLEVGVHL